MYSVCRLVSQADKAKLEAFYAEQFDVRVEEEVKARLKGAKVLSLSDVSSFSFSCFSLSRCLCVCVFVCVYVCVCLFPSASAMSLLPSSHCGYFVYRLFISLFACAA